MEVTVREGSSGKEMVVEADAIIVDGPVTVRPNGAGMVVEFDYNEDITAVYDGSLLLVGFDWWGAECFDNHHIPEIQLTVMQPD